MTDIQVVHCKRHPGPAEYIGRPSPLGNPYPMRSESDRETVIARYRQWLWGQLKADTPAAREIDRLARLHKAGSAIALACWCAPRACHGDVVAKAIRWKADQL